MKFNTIFDNLIRDTINFVNTNTNIDKEELWIFLNQYRMPLKNASFKQRSDAVRIKECKLCKRQFEANKNQRYCGNCCIFLFTQAQKEGIQVNSYIRKLIRKGIV